MCATLPNITGGPSPPGPLPLETAARLRSGVLRRRFSQFKGPGGFDFTHDFSRRSRCPLRGRFSHSWITNLINPRWSVISCKGRIQRGAPYTPQSSEFSMSWPGSSKVGGLSTIRRNISWPGDIDLCKSVLCRLEAADLSILP